MPTWKIVEEYRGRRTYEVDAASEAEAYTQRSAEDIVQDEEENADVTFIEQIEPTE